MLQSDVELVQETLIGLGLHFGLSRNGLKKNRDIETRISTIVSEIVFDHVESSKLQTKRKTQLTFRIRGFIITSEKLSSGFADLIFSYKIAILFSLSHPDGLQ